MLLKVVSDAIIVQQGVVHIKKEYDFLGHDFVPDKSYPVFEDFLFTDCPECSTWLRAGGAFFHQLRTGEPTPASFASILLNWRPVLLPQRKVYDVLVVGSGASGGWVAKEVA